MNSMNKKTGVQGNIAALLYPAFFSLVLSPIAQRFLITRVSLYPQIILALFASAMALPPFCFALAFYLRLKKGVYRLTRVVSSLLIHQRPSYARSMVYQAALALLEVQK